ncbi:unnamed protein product [Rotaria sp. Silwood2]|nr:unnamed protein product [Rotaria sp. Silwood2]CAF4184225.1 unnamed protein product [Rotaria sp. Silwood2]CAF4304823.1 unnamed protein product [Rotaria sp. Silwood2]CAF4454032.1 unnamed protein product [Rotaria sp. Silwood2]
MSSLHLYSFTILIFVICSISTAYDVAVYGATPGGIAAAITAARISPSFSIVIIEPTAYVGGMSTAGGIGLRDLGLELTIMGSVAQEWVHNNYKYYKNVTNPIYQPDMNVSRQSFLDLLSMYPNIQLIIGTGPLIDKSIQINGTRIIQITTVDGRRTWKASVWIDASYEGDLVQYSGASYTWGRESRDQYNELYAGVQPYTTFANFIPNYPVNATLDNGTLAPYISPDKLGPVGSADFNMMGYSYRLCVTPNKKKQAPFVKPANYDPNNFVILQRYIDSLIASGKYPTGPPFDKLVDVLIYRGYPSGDKFDMCDSFGSAFTSDSINLNRNYVNGTIQDRRHIAQIVSDYVLGMIWYILTSSFVPEFTRNSLKKYALCNDQWPENKHIPPQLYVREGLRLINENVFTQNHIVSGLCRNDTIALGSWSHDIHVVTRTANGSYVNNEGAMYKSIAYVNGSKSGKAFEIPYSILLPKRNEVTNLLVPICHAASHVAYAATRVEPHFMLLGGAAGYAAAYSILNGNIDVQAVNISRIQETLLRDGVLLHYPVGHCD